VSTEGPLRGPLRKRDSSLWQREANDWYQEPRWCSDRLFEEERFKGSILDPAAGGGNIVQSGMAAGLDITGSDLIIRSMYAEVQRDWLASCSEVWDNIVCNPPFGLCDDRKAGTHPFVQRCLARTTRKVALLMPANWIQGDKRSRWLEGTPLRRVWFISPRPSMPPGHIIAAGQKPGNGTTDYAWFIWQHEYDGQPEIRWLRKDATHAPGPTDSPLRADDRHHDDADPQLSEEASRGTLL
jgi:hypothetical protein